MCDYITQTNLIHDQGSEMWQRNLDFMELFAGSSVMTRAFRAKNYLSCPGRLLAYMFYNVNLKRWVLQTGKQAACLFRQNYDILLRAHNDILTSLGFAVAWFCGRCHLA